MPKFTAEIDTDNRTVQLLIDGNPVDSDEFCLTRCEYSQMNMDGTSQDYTRTYVSVTQANSAGDEKYTQSIEFVDGENPSYSESMSTNNVGKEMAKVISRTIAASKLSESLGKISKKK